MTLSANYSPPHEPGGRVKATNREPCDTRYARTASSEAGAPRTTAKGESGLVNGTARAGSQRCSSSARCLCCCLVCWSACVCPNGKGVGILIHGCKDDTMVHDTSTLSLAVLFGPPLALACRWDLCRYPFLTDALATLGFFER